MKNSDEVWKPVVGYETSYEVSSFGNVRSIDRYVTNSRLIKLFIKGRPLSLCDTQYGYLSVSIRKKKPKSFLVHHLVAKAFLGDKIGFEINHKDFDKKNNCLSNIEWVTRQENIEHARLAGRFNAFKNPRQAKKLNFEKVKELRLDSKNGLPTSEIAIKYSIHRSTVSKIIVGDIWSENPRDQKKKIIS